MSKPSHPTQLSRRERQIMDILYRDGKATAAEVRAAYAWSSVIQIWALLLFIPQQVFFGGGFTLGTAADADQILAMALGLAQITLGIWSTVVFLKCLGEVHGFSAWKALGASILAGLVAIVPLILLLACVFGVLR